jgi:hypothetical protein
MSRILLKDAQLCIDCDEISDHLGPCENCTSHTKVPLAKFLGERGPAHTCADRPNLPCDACEITGHAI